MGRSEFDPDSRGRQAWNAGREPGAKRAEAAAGLGGRSPVLLRSGLRERLSAHGGLHRWLAARS